MAIEKDLDGALLAQADMDLIRSLILQESVAGAKQVDIVIRNACCVGGVFPEIIIDYGGELLQTLAKALRIIGRDRETEHALRASAFTDVAPNRIGVTTEYKRGEFYLSHTVWEDQHEEVEIHRCQPQQLFHSFDESEKGLPPPEQAIHTCDKNQFTDVFARFALLPAGPAEIEPSVHAQDHFRSLEE